MNIFLLDYHPRKAAQAHCDQHMHKMILESAQMLSTVVHTIKPGHYPAIYGPTHINHPCVKFLLNNTVACHWVYALACYLQTERESVGCAVHDSIWTIHRAMNYLGLDYMVEDRLLEGWASTHASKWPQAMPLKHQVAGDPVTAYRQYYQAKSAGWDKPMTWKDRTQPEWF